MKRAGGTGNPAMVKGRKAKDEPVLSQRPTVPEPENAEENVTGTPVALPPQRVVPPYPPPPKTNHLQRQSKSYILPVQDTDFLLRDELRGVRFALEYEKAELVLRDAGIRSTIVCFGSSRIPSREKAESEMRIAGGKAEKELARKRLKLSMYYEQAREFGRIASQRGGALVKDKGMRDNVIATGGGPGIMEAACRGAADVGAPAIGFNISLPMEQDPNRYTTPDLTFQFHYFAMRKMHLAMRANGMAVFPGGFGTMDEMFEMLTLLQTQKASPLPVVLFGKSYWRKVINFSALFEHGMVSIDDLTLFEFVDSAEEAWDSLLRRGLNVPNPKIRKPRQRRRKLK
jgi:uncharacterized protein (TIGR00730 family)